MLKIKDMNLNSVIRQGDSKPREYQLDTGNLDLNLTNKSATIRLMTADFQGIGYETTATVSNENKISFSIDDVIPAREYRLEITVDDYVFPSRATDGRFDIDPSSHGQEVNIIQIIGKDEIVREVKEQIEPFLGEIEQAELDRQAQEEAREETHEKVKDLPEAFQKLDDQIARAITLPQEEIENIVMNGNFSNGSNDWHTNEATGTVANNILSVKMTVDSIKPNYRIHQQNNNLQLNRQYYFSAVIKVPKNTTLVLALKQTYASLINLNAGEENYVSGVIYTDEASDILNRIQLIIDTSSYTVGDVIEFQKIHVIDITETNLSRDEIRNRIQSVGYISGKMFFDTIPEENQIVGSVGGEIKPRDVSEYNIPLGDSSVSAIKLSPDIRKRVSFPEEEIENTIIDGNFSNGTDNWNLNRYGASSSASNGVATIILGTESIRGSFNPFQLNANLVIGDTYHFSAWIKPDKSGTLVMDLRGNSSRFIDLVAGQWQFVSYEISVTDIIGALDRVSFVFDTTSFSVGDKIQLQKVNLINLSKLEPTILNDYDIDQFIKNHGYIDGKDSVELIPKTPKLTGYDGDTFELHDATSFTSHLYGKTCVAFGDSITGNALINDYPSYVAQRTGMTVYNVGFGGTRAGQHRTEIACKLTAHRT